MKLPKIINLNEVNKEDGSVIYELFMSVKFLNEVGKPGISGMNIDGVKHKSYHPPMPGIATKKYRNIKNRLLDRVKDETVGAMNRIDSEYIPPISKRCRLKDCDLKDRRQRDASFCRACGNELTD